MSKSVITFLIILLSGFALATETIAQLGGEIISINEEHSFVVINLGRDERAYVGSILEVYQDDREIGKMQVLKVRDTIAMAEVIEIKPGAIVKVGDKVILLKKRPKSILEETERKEGKKVKERKETIKAVRDKAIKETPYPEELAKIMADIHAAPEVVWFYLTQALRDYGFIITDSNKSRGLLTARKNLELPLMGEIWADITGETNHEAVLWAATLAKGKGKTYLAFEIEGSYDRGRKRQRFYIERESRVYREVEEIVKKVKGRAER